MTSLLDTNIISLAMSGDSAVLGALTKLEVGDAAISAVTYAEIRYGLLRGLRLTTETRRSGMARKEELFNRLMQHIDVLPLDRSAASAYADERIACEGDGEVLDQADLMILAHAAARGRTLVTRDVALQRRNRKGPHKTRVVSW